MGWGPMLLITDNERDPLEILKEFAEGKFFTAEIDGVSEIPPGKARPFAYSLQADCGMGGYCGHCGRAVCAGCGSQLTLIIVEKGVSAYCRDRSCRSAADRWLQDMFPGLRNP